MTIKFRYWVALLFLPALSACYPDGAEYTDDLDLVYTNYDNQFAFSSKTKYAIPDSVIKITGENFNDPDGNGKPEFMSATYAVPLLAQINQNMASHGWTRVNKNNNPDVILLPSTTTTTNIFYYYDWWYWDWWYGGYWGWYYPYYPAYVSGYRSGSVFVQMIDAKALGAGNDNVPVVWSAIFNGLAEGSSSSITARIQKAIDQAFVQSPYLAH